MKFRVGVLGATGYIGTPYRREIREAENDATIVALCGRRRNLLEQAAAEDQARFVTDDWRQVVMHPEVDLVLVCTPDALHREAVMKCAELGKHLFCEKPVGMNVLEAQEMWNAVKTAKIAHFVPFWTRYVPAFVRAREILQQGTIGELKALVFRWHNPRPLNMPITWRDDASLSSAGSVADVGSHAYDTIRWLANSNAVRVTAQANVITPAKPDLGPINLSEALAAGNAGIQVNSRSRKGTAFDYASIAFELANGVVGTLVVSHAPFIRKGLAPDVELHGTLGSLAVDRIRSTITMARSDSDQLEVETIPDPGFGNRFSKYVFPALRSRINGGWSEHPGMEDGYLAQIFTDATAESARSR